MLKKPSDWQVLKPMLQISIRDCLLEAQAELSFLDNPQHSAIILMAHALNRPKTWIIAHGNETLGERQKTEFFALTKRLAQGEPLPYITGKQSFYGLDFKVSPSVLIPRPETERLVDEASLWLRANPLASHALDVGTGSACIAISLAKNHPALTITALDISEDALNLAKENAQIHGVQDRIAFQQSDLLANFTGQADLICANLPYIPSATLAELSVSAWEPVNALDGGQDGLAFIRRLLEQSHAVLKTPGLILLEIESSTGEPALDLAKTSYPKANVDLLKDLAGKNRLIRIEVLK